MQDVRICLDQNMESDALIESGDIDTLALDEIIKSKILEAIQRVHRDAPNYLLEGGHNFGDAVYWRELESGWVLLPKDFLRLVVLKWTIGNRQSIKPSAPTTPNMRSSTAASRAYAVRHSVQYVPLAYVQRAGCWSSIHAKARTRKSAVPSTYPIPR